MDSAETLAKQYLEHLALGKVVYEPDGKIPPDFVIDGRIAVEVRRLNQNFEADGTFRGLESDAAAIYRFVDKTLKKLGPARSKTGWWVSYRFRRPLDLAAVKREFPKAMKTLSNLPIAKEIETTVTDNFTIHLRPTGIELTHHFSIASYTDYDAGGWIAAEVIRNLNLCISEKELKIAPYRDRYVEWWLVLLDLIGTSLNEEDRAPIAQHVSRGSWDRIILLDPRDPVRAYEV